MTYDSPPSEGEGAWALCANASRPVGTQGTLPGIRSAPSTKSDHVRYWLPTSSCFRPLPSPAWDRDFPRWGGRRGLHLSMGRSQGGGPNGWTRHQTKKGVPNLSRKASRLRPFC